ncbi:MAG: sigma factor G inhibitor Gin [Bacillota bacterium]|nr:sigma factor G inhibitor Gin [Bacillota bacterium]HHU60511.1 hypothetical protein [Natronincola sp.]
MRCLICQIKVDYDALYFWGERICSDCEAQIMESTVEQPSYQEIARVFQLMWKRKYFEQHNHHFLEGDRV